MMMRCALVWLLSCLVLVLVCQSLGWAQTVPITGNLVVSGHVNSCQDTGMPNALACNLDYPITAYLPRVCYSVQAAANNTGPTTVNIQGLGPKALVKVQGSVTMPLAPNDIRAGQLVQMCDAGVQMQMTSPLGNAPTGGASGGGAVSSGTVTLPAATLASGTCSLAHTASAPGAQPTDVVLTSFQGDPTAISGYGPSASGTVSLVPYTLTGAMAVKVCNNTTQSITTGDLTLNWKVLAGGVLPPGVTLRDIDGGPTYYCGNGFVQACNAGWDDPSFFPVGLWLAPLHTQADADRWHDVGINLAIGITTNSSLNLLVPNNIHLVAQASEFNDLLTALGGSLGAETVGILAWDEPVTYAQATQAVQTILNIHQDGRYWSENFTWNQVHYGDVEGHPMASLLSEALVTPNTTTRHLDLAAADMYWFAGNGNTGAFNGQLLYNLPAPMTADQMRRGYHYGDMLDRQRLWQQGHFPAPIFNIVEDGGPYTENTTGASYIQPPEFNAAVWSGIIHGARGLGIFNHTFGGPALSIDNLATAYFQTPQAGQSISIYDQVKATLTQVKTLAPVINAPFADTYVTVAPPPTDFAGFDVMAKYAGQQFYVFAMPRYSPTLVNQNATFTVASGTIATVLGESRSIGISGGQFTDTFATAHTVHIYRID